MRQRLLQWAAGIDENKKEIAKTSLIAITKLLDLSSRVLLQLPKDNDSKVLRIVKYVALADSIYKSLIKNNDDDTIESDYAEYVESDESNMFLLPEKSIETINS